MAAALWTAAGSRESEDLAGAGSGGGKLLQSCYLKPSFKANKEVECSQRGLDPRAVKGLGGRGGRGVVHV